MEEAAGCHLVFLAGDKATRRDPGNAFKDAPLLTVGENIDFLDAGGMVCLLKKEGNIKMGVDVDSAARAGLVMNSRLLSVAAVVRGGRKTQ